MPDANEPIRQHVLHEAAEKFEWGQRHDALPVALRIVFVAEADGVAINLRNATIRDGDAVSVAGDVFKYLFGLTKGWLGVHDPFLLTELIAK